MRHLLWIAAVVVLVVAMSAFGVPGWLLGVVVVAAIVAECAIPWASTVAFARWARTQKR
jgi:hypothetical protein